MVDYQFRKKFQNQGFPQQRLHTTDIDDNNELSIDRLTPSHAINQSIDSNLISYDSNKVINYRSQTLIEDPITIINFRSLIVTLNSHPNYIHQPFVLSLQFRIIPNY